MAYGFNGMVSSKPSFSTETSGGYSKRPPSQSDTLRKLQQSSGALQKKTKKENSPNAKAKTAGRLLVDRNTASVGNTPGSMYDSTKDVHNEFTPPHSVLSVNPFAKAVNVQGRQQTLAQRNLKLSMANKKVK